MCPYATINPQWLCWNFVGFCFIFALGANCAFCFKALTNKQWREYMNYKIQLKRKEKWLHQERVFNERLKKDLIERAALLGDNATVEDLLGPPHLEDYLMSLNPEAYFRGDGESTSATEASTAQSESEADTQSESEAATQSDSEAATAKSASEASDANDD